MLRIFFLYLSKANWAKKLVMNWNLAKKLSSRFIAGENNEQALLIAKKLNHQGYRIALDPLGENTDTIEAANAATLEIVELIEKIHLKQVDAYVSIKLTQLGLVFDKELCLENLETILAKARQANVFIRVDMEDSSVTEETISVVTWMRSIYPNVGIVIQSYLFRSENDVRSLINLKTPIRMVKGAYQEPKEIAFPQKKDVDSSFDRLSKQILGDFLKNQSESTRTILNPPILALGTHDEDRIKEIVEFVRIHGYAQEDFEIQMLYGIRRDLQQKYLNLGYPVRVYVPYGTYWYPYFMRRLAERPANVWFLFSNLLKK